MKNFSLEIDYSCVPDFIPLYVSNTIIGFFITTFLFGLMILPICTKIFWQILWYYRFTLFYMVLPIIVIVILKTLFRKSIYDDKNFAIRF
jgi:hypothetical protein